MLWSKATYSDGHDLATGVNKLPPSSPELPSAERVNKLLPQYFDVFAVFYRHMEISHEGKSDFSQ